MNRITPFFQTEVIKVLLGQRRVGKSSLLKLIHQELLKKHPDLPVIFIEKEKEAWGHIRNSADLLKAVKSLPEFKENRIAVLVDEVQEIEDFASAIRSLQAEGRYDIYISGSNARLLSGEIATFFAGRSVNFVIHSLSYQEFLDFHDKTDSDAALLDYLKFGGLPYLAQIPLTDDVALEYLSAITDTILLRDIADRFSVRNLGFLRKLVEFCADNVGSQTSAKKISDFLKSQRIQMSPQIVLTYLDHLTSAFLFLKTQRLNIFGKQLFAVGEKYYMQDLGLRTSLRGFKQSDLGKIVENAVYLRLLQSNYQVTTGQLGDKVVDFVAEKGNRTIYFQVALSVQEEKAFQREFGNLLQIPDQHPKYVISLDSMRADEKGVRHLHLREFLMMEW